MYKKHILQIHINSNNFHLFSSSVDIKLVAEAKLRSWWPFLNIYVQLSIAHHFIYLFNTFVQMLYKILFDLIKSNVQYSNIPFDFQRIIFSHLPTLTILLSSYSYLDTRSKATCTFISLMFKFRLYRDDGLTYMVNVTGHTADKMRREIVKTKIRKWHTQDIVTNLKIVIA